MSRTVVATALRLLPVVVLLSTIILACEGTPGRRIVVRFAYVAAPEAGLPLGEFDTDTGFHVALTEARVAIGPVYALRGAARASLAKQPARALAMLFGPSIARAHGGVDPLSGREILAQALEQHAFDALAPEAVITPRTIGTAGAAETVTVLLEPPGAANDAALHGHHAYVEGTATKDSVTIPFAGGIDLEDSGTTRRVENVALGAALDDDGVVTLRIRPAAWLREAFFDRLGPADADGVHPILPGVQVAGALRIGLRSQSAYEASYSTEVMP